MIKLIVTANLIINLGSLYQNIVRIHKVYRIRTVRIHKVYRIKTFLDNVAYIYTSENKPHIYQLTSLNLVSIQMMVTLWKNGLIFTS